MALDNPEFVNKSVDVVTGNNHPSPDVVEKLVSGRSNTNLYSGLPSLAALMIRADLILGAGGSTNWERMCLGLNSLVFSVAKNQELINETLGYLQMSYYLGYAKDAKVEMIVESLRHATNSASEISIRSQNMRAIVDGGGCLRVCQILVDF